VGSYHVKAGFAGLDAPLVRLRTVVGYTANREAYVGSTALLHLKELTEVVQPLSHGIVVDVDAMEKIYDYTLEYGLCVDPSEHPFLWTDKPCGFSANREKMTELVFEKYNVPAAYVAYEGIIAMYASGSTTGLSVTCGHNRFSFELRLLTSVP
jgi:actin-related protein